MTTDRLPTEWYDIVARLERRNGVVELRIDNDRLNAEQAKHRYDGAFRTRVLAIRDGQWIVERPVMVEGSSSLARGVPVIAVIGANARRWAFDAAIGNVETFQLNAELRVPALRLSPPKRVRPFQRRAYFRVSMIGADLEPATLWPLLDPDSADAALEANRILHKTGNTIPTVTAPLPELGPSFQASVIDLSGNGLAIQVRPHYKPLLSEHELFWVELRLPGHKHPFVFAAKCVRACEVDDDVLVGLTCSLGVHRAHEQFIIDQICRFAADEQRRQLQRQR